MDTVNFDKDSVTLQDVALAEMRMPIFREEPLALVRELYEQEQEVMEHPLPDYKVGDNVIVDLPTRTIEGTIGYVGETDVRIDTSAHGQSWDNEVSISNNSRRACGRTNQILPGQFVLKKRLPYTPPRKTICRLTL